MIVIKTAHVICAMLSIGGFIVRGVWALSDSALLKARLTKVLPHLIDTLLLVSALVLAYQYSLNPLTTPWLAAKILALLVYITLGSIAIKRASNHHQRLLAWLSAITVFGYIVLVAVTKSPWLGLIT